VSLPLEQGAAASAWTIRRDPEEAPWETKDGRGWSWEIERDFELRRLLVEVTVSAEAVASDEVRRVVETCGRTAVESVLADDDPPYRITFTAAGRTEWPFRAKPPADE
jgi:hypothetical protein